MSKRGMKLEDLDDDAFFRVAREQLERIMKKMVSVALADGMEFPVVVDLTDDEGERSTFLMTEDCGIDPNAELSDLWLCPLNIVFTDRKGRTLSGTPSNTPFFQ